MILLAFAKAPAFFPCHYSPCMSMPFTAPTSLILSHFIIFIKRKETTYKINLSKGLHYNGKPLTGSRLPKHRQKSILISIFGFNEKWLQNWHLANTVEICGEMILINFLLKCCGPWISAIKWYICWYQGFISVSEFHNKRLLNGLQVYFIPLLLSYRVLLFFP